MKIVFSFLFLFSFIFANNSDIAKRYFIDKSNSINIESIIKDKSIFKEIKKYSLGIQKNNVWIYITLKNNTNKPYIKRIYNNRAGLDFVDGYIVKDNKLIKTYLLGDMREYKIRDNQFRVSYFDLEINPSESLDIFIKQKAYSSMDLRWHIKDLNSFENYFDIQASIYAFISGLLSVTVLSSFILFLFLRDKFYLFYGAFSFSVIIYQIALAGFFYQWGFPLWTITILNFPFPMIVLIILGFFPIYFFDLKKDEFKITIYLLKALMIILLAFITIEFFYPLNYDLLYLTSYTTIVSLIFIFTLFILSIKTFLAKKRGSLFYLLANLTQFIFISLYILVLIGVLKYSDFYHYTLSIGSIGQDIFLLFALIYSTYMIKKEHDKNQQLLYEYSKLSFIGQTMVNISHQWKSPINNIYNSINHIEIAKEFKDSKLDEIIDTNIKKIKDTTIYLRDTALNQLNFYKEKENIELINLNEEITHLIKLIENEFTKKDIEIKLICNDSLVVKIEKNYFLNLLMIFFENSFKIFEQRKIGNPKIILKIRKEDSKLIVNFEDNAQGVNPNMLDKIFEKDFSKSNSTGIGLHLAKEIVEYKLNGKIAAQNTKEGLAFKIWIEF